MMGKWRLRYGVRKTPTRADGAHALRFGVLVGYWPCLMAPYISLGVGKWIVEAWIGYPSYRAPQ